MVTAVGMIGIYQQIYQVDNLNNHLAKKLNTLGIPKQLRNTVYTFDYNDFEGLKLLSNDLRLE